MPTSSYCITPPKLQSIPNKKYIYTIRVNNFLAKEIQVHLCASANPLTSLWVGLIENGILSRLSVNTPDTR